MTALEDRTKEWLNTQKPDKQEGVALYIEWLNRDNQCQNPIHKKLTKELERRKTPSPIPLTPSTPTTEPCPFAVFVKDMFAEFRK